MITNNYMLEILEIDRRKLIPWVAGGAILMIICAAIFALVISGKTRRNAAPPTTPDVLTPTSTQALVPSRLDGTLTTPEEANRAPWAVMIDHQVDARPNFGVSAASVVIESPVEGGITRLMALFAATSTLPEIGPVRSARPYFVDWAKSWNAMYVHVGGSPEALDMIKAMSTSTFRDANEMFNGWAFWRAANRTAPHNILTNGERMSSLAQRRGYASSTISSVWHFMDVNATTTIGDITRVAVPYGGSYNVVWRFDKDINAYVRSIGGKKAADANGTEIEASNIIVIKTEEQIMDDKGRLRIRTTGSGDAIAYRNGRKFSIRWRRSPNEQIRFETIDGTEFLLQPGKTWIEVTTNDTIFAGLES